MTSRSTPTTVVAGSSSSGLTSADALQVSWPRMREECKRMLIKLLGQSNPQNNAQANQLESRIYNEARNNLGSYQTLMNKRLEELKLHHQRLARLKYLTILQKQQGTLPAALASELQKLQEITSFTLHFQFMTKLHAHLQNDSIRALLPSIPFDSKPALEDLEWVKKSSLDQLTDNMPRFHVAAQRANALKQALQQTHLARSKGISPQVIVPPAPSTTVAIKTARKKRKIPTAAIPLSPASSAAAASATKTGSGFCAFITRAGHKSHPLQQSESAVKKVLLTLLRPTDPQVTAILAKGAVKRSKTAPNAEEGEEEKGCVVYSHSLTGKEPLAEQLQALAELGIPSERGQNNLYRFQVQCLPRSPYLCLDLDTQPQRDPPSFEKALGSDMSNERIDQVGNIFLRQWRVGTSVIDTVVDWVNVLLAHDARLAQLHQKLNMKS